MLYRAVAFLVIAFWLTMTALLVRNEVHPADSALREVPFSHVVKLLFHHHQDSKLNIISDKTDIGNLRVHPQIDADTNARVIAFDGNLQLNLPGQKPQRIKWDGTLELEPSLATKRFRLAVVTHHPDKLRTEIIVTPPENRAHYEVAEDTAIVDSQDFTLDEQGARRALDQLGIDPMLLPSPQSKNAISPVLKAAQSSIEIHGERIDTYRVSMEYNGQTLFEFHVDQIGHILQATTLLGYSLLPDDVTP